MKLRRHVIFFQVTLTLIAPPKVSRERNSSNPFLRADEGFPDTNTPEAKTPKPREFMVPKRSKVDDVVDSE